MCMLHIKLYMHFTTKSVEKKSKVILVICKIKTVVETVVLCIYKTIKLFLRTTTHLIMC